MGVLCVCFKRRGFGFYERNLSEGKLTFMYAFHVNSWDALGLFLLPDRLNSISMYVN